MPVRYLAAALAASAALIPAAPTLAQQCVPEVVAITATPCQAKDILVQDNLAYITDACGMLIFDIADPTAPQELGFFDSFDPMLGVAVVGDFAYIVEARFNASCGFVEVVDVSDPTNPVLVNSTIYDDRPIAISVKGDTAYLSLGDAVFPNRNFIQVLDVSDPSDPQPVTTVQTRMWPHGSLVQGDLLYLALRGGFDIYDISSPQDPVLLGTTNVASLALKVVVQDGFAYLAEFDTGMRIIDVRDPANPVSVAVVKAPGTVFGVDVQGDLAVVPFAQVFPGGFLLVNIRDRSNPQVIGRFENDDGIENIRLLGQLAIAADPVQSLLTLDIRTCVLCPADLDGDGDTDSDDFFSYLESFVARNLTVCDIDNDGDCDADDFFAYLDLFIQPCN